jgi:prevent-host-death family protein
MRTFSASEARQGFAELLESTREGPVMIERQKRGVAVVMSVEEYDRLVAERRGYGAPVPAGHMVLMEPVRQAYGSRQPGVLSAERNRPRKKRQMGTLKGKLPDFEGFDDWMADEIDEMFNGKDPSPDSSLVEEGGKDK